MHASLGHLLTACALFVLAAGLTFEYFRFQDALHVATQEHLSYHAALSQTACARDPHVRAIEWRGQVLDCQVARLILERTPRKSAYILWWNQSAWVALWQRIAHDTIVVTVLCTVLITSVVGFGMHTLSYMHLNKNMASTFDKFAKRQQQHMLALPPAYHSPLIPQRRLNPQKLYVEDVD